MRLSGAKVPPIFRAIQIHFRQFYCCFFAKNANSDASAAVFSRNAKESLSYTTFLRDMPNLTVSGLKQRALFERIAQRYNRRSELVEELSRLLHLEQTAVYQRIRGLKILNLDEYTLILRHFDIPDTLINLHLNDHILIQYPILNGKGPTVDQWMEPIVAELRMLAQIPNAHIYYAANEMPFLHYFQRPVLAMFKIFVWNYFTWQQSGNTTPTLTSSYLHAWMGSHQRTFEELCSIQCKIPSTEIWHTTLLNNTISQIEYLSTVHILTDSKLQQKLIQDLHSLLHQLEEWAAIGHKGNETDAPIAIYHNEIVHTNNLALIDTPTQQLVMFAYDNPNYMRSKDENLCQHTERFFKKLIAHSTSISGSSQKARSLLFNALHNRVAQLESRLANRP
jgi:hypothetical protein